MKLYELKRNTKFTLDGRTYMLDHIDGMYSLCLDEAENVVHIAAWTEVEELQKAANRDPE